MSNEPANAVKRMRSPSHPSINLAEAINLAKMLWDKDRMHPMSLGSMSTHWGFTPGSSSVLTKSASLKHFGLLNEIRGGSPGRTQLSDSALKILANEDLNSPERLGLVKKAALLPAVHTELWDKYAGQLPSDVTMKTYLVGERGFNPATVNKFLNDFRETISFAKLSPGDILSSSDELEPESKTVSPPAPLGSATQKAGSPAVVDSKTSTGVPMMPEQTMLTLPLDDGKSVSVPIGMSEDTFNLFLETLQLWKKRIVAKWERKAIWKNSDTDKPVLIIGELGEQNGEKYYKSSDGTGIPGSELTFTS